MSSLCDLPTTTLRAMIGAKQLSPVELLNDCKARIDAVNPRLNALVSLSLIHI